MTDVAFKHRDALGVMHNVRQYTHDEPARASEAVFRVPREENVHFNHHTVVLDTTGHRVQGPDTTKITGAAAPVSTGAPVPRPKRVLPTLPAAGVSTAPFLSSKEALGFEDTAPTPRSATADAFSPDKADPAMPTGAAPRPLPPLLTCRFCTATGASTCLPCMHCDNIYCLACLNSPHGSMFAQDSAGAPVLRCGQCRRNPRSCPIAERPPWQGTTSLAGAPLLPVVGVDLRDHEQLQKPETKLFVSLLRTDTPVATAEPPPADDGELPSVYQRLTDHKTFSGAHKHRFSADGVGLGLEGRRDNTHMQNVIAGNGTITRDLEPEMDFPHRPLMAFDTTTSPRRPTSVSRMSSVDEDMPEVYARLTKAPVPKPGEYESMQNVRRKFGFTEHKAAWQ